MNYPPETAPKDRVILGEFGCPTMLPTIWNPIHQQWCIAMLDVDLYEGEWQDTSFTNEYADASRLKGWLPMKWVDKELKQTAKKRASKRTQPNQ